MPLSPARLSRGNGGGFASGFARGPAASATGRTAARNPQVFGVQWVIAIHPVSPATDGERSPGKTRSAGDEKSLSEFFASSIIECQRLKIADASHLEFRHLRDPDCGGPAVDRRPIFGQDIRAGRFPARVECWSPPKESIAAWRRFGPSRLYFPCPLSRINTSVRFRPTARGALDGLLVCVGTA